MVVTHILYNATEFIARSNEETRWSYSRLSEVNVEVGLADLNRFKIGVPRRFSFIKSLE